MTESPLDLRTMLGTARRRWAAIAGLLAAGIVGGVLATLLTAPAYESRALVLLPASPVDASGQPLRDIKSEVLLARSNDALARAGQHFSPPVAASVLRRHVSTRALSDDIVEVRAEGGTAAAAKLLADSVAQEYVALSAGASGDQADSTIAVLQSHATELENRVRQLESDIASGVARLAGIDQRSAEGARQGALIDSMRSEQVDASRQLASVNTRIAEARLSAELRSHGTRVLQSGEKPGSPIRPRPLLLVGGGGLIGLLLGGVLVLVLDRNDGRLRRRDEIARAAAAPVIASLVVPPRFGAARLRSVLQEWQPNATERLAYRRAVEKLDIPEEEPRVNLVLVVLPGDRPATMVPVQLAAFAAGDGTATALVVASGDQTLSDLRTACGLSLDDSVRPGLAVFDMVVGSDTGEVAAAELTIHVVVARPGRLRVPASDRSTFTMLAVSSAFASADMLAAAAVQCLEAGYSIQGVFVVNPDPGDVTTGAVEPAFRPGRPAPPVRTNVHDLPALHARDQRDAGGRPDKEGFGIGAAP